jgi:hypothetical protein
MPVLVSIIVIAGFTFLVILGALRLITDLLAMSTHRQPFFPDEFPEEARGSLDLNRPATSSFAAESPARSAAARHTNAV